ncbi:MAG: helix-turn-helix domain-containing protein [Xanthomonadales bacterium]|jgi:AraC-like DNA-binding protein|nr:helix-turn-helix domain-containing protein [Xanthomonadales bacterium]
MEVIFIIGAAQAFFLPLLIFNKAERSRADYVLAAWFVLIGLALLGHYLEVTGRAADFPIFLGFWTCFPMLMGPAAYVYALAVTRGDEVLKPTLLLHALPYLVFTVIVFFRLFAYSSGSVEADRLAIEDPSTPVFIALGLFRIFLGPVYLVLCLLILKRHARRIADEFSYTRDIDLGWLKKVILAMLTIWITVVVVNIMGNFNDWISIEQGDNLIYLTVTAVVFFGGFYGIKQQIIFASPAGPPAAVSVTDNDGKETRYRKSSLNGEQSRAILGKLLEFMDEEKPYLDGKVSLSQVADRLGVSSNHLSQVINENLEKNFYDFINGYRVDMVKQRLAESTGSRPNILAIAYDAGFSSKSSFNEVFKKNTKLTPSQYWKKLGK